MQTFVRVYRPVAIGIGVLWSVPLVRWILAGVITGKLRAAAMTIFPLVRASYGFAFGYGLTSAIAGAGHLGHGRERLLIELAGGVAGVALSRPSAQREASGCWSSACDA